MYLKELNLKNFRCFKEKSIELVSPITLIEGNNGTGKTSLLEALYYGCYLRSFRTRSPHEMMVVDSESGNFFIKLMLEHATGLTHELQAGYSAKKRSVKVDQKPVSSYKDIVSLYRVIALTEDDLALIKGSPDKRRSFIDHYVMLYNPELVITYRKLKKTIEHRQALFHRYPLNREDYMLWTEQLWSCSRDIRVARIKALERLVGIVQELLHKLNRSTKCSLVLSSRYADEHASFGEFVTAQQRLIDQELTTKKGLFGAHLDDIDIQWDEKPAKLFASRGQQKLLTVLLKVAQVKDIRENLGVQPIFVLDDFLTDFDYETTGQLIELLVGLDCQLIFTCPLEESYLKDRLQRHGASVIRI